MADPGFPWGGQPVFFANFPRKLYENEDSWAEVASLHSPDPRMVTNIFPSWNPSYWATAYLLQFVIIRTNVQKASGSKTEYNTTFSTGDPFSWQILITVLCVHQFPDEYSKTHLKENRAKECPKMFKIKKKKFQKPTVWMLLNCQCMWSFDKCSSIWLNRSVAHPRDRNGCE